MDDQDVDQLGPDLAAGVVVGSAGIRCAERLVPVALGQPQLGPGGLDRHRLGGRLFLTPRRPMRIAEGSVGLPTSAGMLESVSAAACAAHTTEAAVTTANLNHIWSSPSGVALVAQRRGTVPRRFFATVSATTDLSLRCTGKAAQYCRALIGALEHATVNRRRALRILRRA